MKRILKGLNFTGPRTRLDIRTSGYPNYIPNGEIVIPKSKLDAISRDDDISYDKIKRDYLQNGNKEEHMKQIHEADDKYINEASKEGLRGKLAAALIKLKKKGEQMGLPSKTFSGFGKSRDPAYRLKLKARKYKIASHNNNSQTNINKTRNSRRIQKGGLAPYLLALLAAAGIKLTEKVVDFICDKIRNKIEGRVEGRGLVQQLSMLSPIQKKKFLISYLK